MCVPVPGIEIDAVCAACLLQQIVDMKFDCALGDEQVLRNLGIGLFLQGKSQNRTLAYGQLILPGEILELFLRCSLSLFLLPDDDRHIQARVEFKEGEY